MASVSGGYATVATTYGKLPADSYYTLQAPGVVNGDQEITGALRVDGTTDLVGPVTMESSLTAAAVSATSIVSSGAITGTTVTGTSIVQTGSASSSFAGPASFAGPVGLNGPLGFVGPLIGSSYGTATAPIAFPYSATCSQSVLVVQMIRGGEFFFGADIPLDPALFSVAKTIAITSQIRFNVGAALINSFSGVVSAGGTTGVQLNLVMSTTNSITVGASVDVAVLLINSP